MTTPDGRARCPRCDVPLNDERRPADFTDHMSGINLCPACESNEAEKMASYGNANRAPLASGDLRNDWSAA